MLQIDASENLPTLLSDSLTWDRLSRGVPFRQAAWLQPWWEILGQNCQATVITARDQKGELKGILPLYRKPHERTLSIIGDGDACSDHSSVLARDEDAVAVAREMGKFLASICQCSRHGWDLLDIDGIIEGDPVAAALMCGLKSGGANLHASSRMSVWSRPASRSWEEHVRCHGKTQRRKLKKWASSISSHDCLDKIVAVTEDELQGLLDAMMHMHQRRWNQVGQPGSFASRQFRAFMHEACRRFMLQGQLYFSTLHCHRQFIAGMLNVIGGDRMLYSYSAGYDTDFADLEPGRILCVDSLTEIYRSNLTGIDFMRGDEAYKERLATESKKLYRIRVVAPALVPRIRHAVWTTGFEVKQWFRRRTGRTQLVVGDEVQLS